jgi:hypothetical protein
MIMQKDANGLTPLHIGLLRHAQPAVLSMLLIQCPRVAEVLCNGKTMLHFALEKKANTGAVDKVQCLVFDQPPFSGDEP